MRAAGLKAIDTVVSSTAVLISSKHPSDPKLVNKVTNRIRGVITAQKWVLCAYNVPRHLLSTVSKITPGRRAPTVTSLEEDGWVAISVMIERSQLANKMDELAEAGAVDILVTNIENSRATA
jgi:ATP phosphoribosyltransferase